MTYTRRDYDGTAAALNSVLRHSLPDTIKTRSETIYLAAKAISRDLKGRNYRFDEDRFMVEVFKGFEQYRPDHRPHVDFDEPDGGWDEYKRSMVVKARRPRDTDDLDASDQAAMARLARKAFKLPE